MALITKEETERRDIPHEPGEWMEFRRLTWGVAKRLQGLDPEQGGTLLMESGIAAWSYGEPVTPETLDQLDLVTANWAADQISELAGLDRRLGEASADRSNGTTSPAVRGRRS